MDVLIPIVFPDYKISALGKKWEGLGHAGILFVPGSTGTTKYYEYGRYDKAEKGQVRKLTIPNVRIDKSTGKIDMRSLAEVLTAISQQSGQSTRIAGAFIEQDGYQKVLDYVEGRRKANSDPRRKEYGLFSNNCATFMQQSLDRAGVNTPWMLDPRPNSYIDELRADYPTLDYDPKTKALKIDFKIGK
jgi:hypothetical protein